MDCPSNAVWYDVRFEVFIFLKSIKLDDPLFSIMICSQFRLSILQTKPDFFDLKQFTISLFLARGLRNNLYTFVSGAIHKRGHVSRCIQIRSGRYSMMHGTPGVGDLQLAGCILHMLVLPPSFTDGYPIHLSGLGKSLLKMITQPHAWSRIILPV